ncbi:putative sugar nucleotidyl transferase [Chitinophaga tropicalis]|uniref:Glucose-1-phosphate thymidylyltransferase n=1 Tax=Chitinophaga tropicalis TaxID=2683588 RepID=A0A7K1U8T9_9BACT|nr:putative sugar nucleotidyl transferase [Chitinophaga tropicalis]MVT10415.1 glucose-1-phosphate thymidylyltransferase [Chitinophaga tropicalis]
MKRNYILFDTPARDLLYPFTHTRPVAACRTGILTIREKWERWLNAGTSYLTVTHLQQKYPLYNPGEPAVNVLISGHLLPDATLTEAVRELKVGQSLYKDDYLLAKAVEGTDPEEAGEKVGYEGPVKILSMPWEIFLWNDQAIRDDFKLLTAGRISAPIPASNRVTAPENIFIEEGAVVEHSILNAATGPIYIGKEAEVMEGCLVRGPLALGQKAVLKMGTRVYGATTLGPYSVGGGEIKNVVMFGYSNKGHDGYLGDAVLGEWCNLGANTTCSNLKNNGSAVRIWIEALKETRPAGQKCGVLMGDYSRCGVGTILNTGTVIGVSCNIFGGDFPPKFVPSFSWGGANVLEPYRLDEALKDAAVWMRFKGQELGEAEASLLKTVFESV